MENINTKNYNDYVVIGLGRFGKSLALNQIVKMKNFGICLGVSFILNSHYCGM